jgi:hypothetical protein
MWLTSRTGLFAPAKQTPLSSEQWLGRLHSRYEGFREEKNLFPLQELEQIFLGVSVVL